MRSAQRSLLFGVVLVVLAAGAFLFVKLRESAEASEQRELLFRSVERVLATGDRQHAELSRLVAGLEALPGDRRVALALARIELLRQRYERAARLLEPYLLGQLDLQEARAATVAWLRWPLHGGRDGNERRGLWRRALEFAEAAYATSRAPEDLFRAWQAAVRIPDDAASKRIAARLEAQHAGSLEARTIALLLADEAGGDDLDRLVGEWAEVPVEVDLRRNVALILAQQTEAAARRFDELLQRAPNLVEVRNWAAFAHHQAANALPEGDARRGRHQAVRDACLTWLQANARPDDARHGQWAAMLGQG